MAHRLAFRAVPTPLKQMLAGRNIVALYMALDDEAPAHRLAEALMMEGKTLCLPHVIDRMGTMDFRAWQPGDALVEGRFGTRSPGEDAPLLIPDAILAPLVAFDGQLNRLGQGGGYYDRTFARLSDALRVGVGWSVQQLDTVPNDPWDLPLHAILTERSFITHPDTGAAA
jgi:5-formyltetrahydrofolate cyclo-ligase